MSPKQKTCSCFLVSTWFLQQLSAKLQTWLLNHIQQRCSHTFSEYLSVDFQDNIKFFIDNHVGGIFQHICENKIEVDDTMYSIIIPITIEYINVFTIQNALALGTIAINAAKLNLQSEKLWEAIFAKLDGQNVYKYLNHGQIAELLAAIVNQGTYIDHPLVGKLSATIAQQKAHYQHFPALMSLIRETNATLQAKSPQTLQIAENLKQVTAWSVLDSVKQSWNVCIVKTCLKCHWINSHKWLQKVCPIKTLNPTERHSTSNWLKSMNIWSKRVFCI